MSESESVFDARCKNDPQGVIQDLLAQTQRQAGEIYRQLILVEAILTPEESKLLLKMAESQNQVPTELITKLKISAAPPKEPKVKKQRKLYPI